MAQREKRERPTQCGTERKEGEADTVWHRNKRGGPCRFDWRWSYPKVLEEFKVVPRLVVGVTGHVTSRVTRHAPRVAIPVPDGLASACNVTTNQPMTFPAH